MSDSPGSAPPSGGSGTPGAPPAPAGGEGSAAPDKAQAAPAPAPQKYKLGDEEFDEATLRGLVSRGKNSAQLMTKAEQRMREAAEKERKAEAAREAFKDRQARAKLLKEWGLDERQLAEELLLPYVQQEMLSPEQQAVAAAKREAEEARALLKQREEADKQAQLEKDTQAYQERFGAECHKALEALDYPREAEPFLIPFIAKAHEMMVDEEGAEFSPADAAEYVDGILTRTLQRMAEKMSGEQLVKKYGEAFAKKINAYNLQRIKERLKPVGGQSPVQAPRNGTPSNGTPKGGFKSFDEWEAELARRTQG